MKINIIIIFSLLLLFASCDKKVKESSNPHEGHDMEHVSKSDTSKEVIYWCPMDTQIVQKKPGVCPICGMDLEPKPMAHNHDSMSQKDWVYTPANVSVLSTVKFIMPVMKTVPVKIKVTGYISYDERRIYTIPAKVGGRIEKLHVKYNFQPITKGQALFEIYSHDLQTAQQEYLFIKRNDPNATDLINAAKKKLLLLGMTEGQINKISEGDHVHATTTVYSPYSGFVIEKKEQKETFAAKGSMEDNSNMGEGQNTNENNKEISLREGAYVDRGENVFMVANTEVVWAIFEVYSNQLAQIKINQLIHIMLENTDEMIMGKINFIEPAYKKGSGTTKLRVYLDNKNQNLKIGNLLSGEIEADDKKGLWISQSAVYDLGVDKIVFIKRNGAFETRKIIIGYSSGKEVEVISGLSEGEEIAENAQFMIDSESFVKVSK
jgi:membrane fusion protein, copper/silver efflux system